MSAHEALLNSKGALVYSFLSYSTFGLVRWYFYKRKYYGNFRESRTVNFHSIEVVIGKDVKVRFLDKEGKQRLMIRTGVNIPEYSDYKISHPSLEQLRLEFAEDGTSLEIQHRLEEDHHMYEFHWESPSVSPLMDEVLMSEESHWYGGGLVYNQNWPVEKWNSEMGPFVAQETSKWSTSYGNIQNRVWFSSSGIALKVSDQVPLFVSVNDDFDRKIKLMSCFKAPYTNTRNEKSFLTYSVIQTEEGVGAAFRSLTASTDAKPKKVPNLSLFRYPIWSTQCLENLDQDSVLRLAETVIHKGLKGSQIDVDDRWTTSCGNWSFEPRRFPDPSTMVSKLHKLGFKVSLRISPFGSLNSDNRTPKNRWVMRKLFILELPVYNSWQERNAALLDLTNEQGVQNFRDSLQSVQEQFKIDTFSTLGASADCIPFSTSTYKPLSTPNTYTRAFAELVSGLDTTNRSQILDTGVSDQRLPLFFRLSNKQPKWHGNGLNTIIPQVLTLGLLGYPFINPGNIGGKDDRKNRPDRELYIRWLQVTTLMPCMQFSLPPWDYYDKPTVNIARSMCKLRESYADYMIHLAEEAVETGAPIVRPLWWVAADDDEAALTSSSQFMLGDEVLVAPILQEGARARDVYLPTGMWRDEISNNQLKGGQWHRNYPAELEQLLHFTRLPHNKEVPA